MINIKGDEYEISEVIEKISIADSFVVPRNKIGEGNGEAKLYVGQSSKKLELFFGNRGFIVNCILFKNNLLDYLKSARKLPTKYAKTLCISYIHNILTV